MNYFLATMTSEGPLLCTSPLNNDGRWTIIGPLSATESLIKLITYHDEKIAVLAYGDQWNCQSMLENLGFVYRSAKAELKIPKDASFTTTMDHFARIGMHDDNLKDFRKFNIGLVIMTDKVFYHITPDGGIRRSAEYVFPHAEVADSYFCFAKPNEKPTMLEARQSFENALSLSGSGSAFPYFYCTMQSDKLYMVNARGAEPQEAQ
jgi:hypothetical protein